MSHSYVQMSHSYIHVMLHLYYTSNQEKEIKQNKQPNNGQCCLFIVGVSTGFRHAMTFLYLSHSFIDMLQSYIDLSHLFIEMLHS